ncbi:MAG: iron ABC transporter permease [Pseudomonadota bacterium]
MRVPALLAGGITLLIALVLASIAVGSVTIPLADVTGALSRALDTAAASSEAGVMDSIVMDLRLPRTLFACLIGAGLGITGVLLQTATRNDLADPFLFGLSSGAATGAVLVITVTGDLLGIWTLPLAAFVGGMIAAVIVLALVGRLGSTAPEKLVLAGLAVSFLFSALTHFLIFAGDHRAAHSVVFWMLGGLGLARWSNILLVLAGFAAIFAFAITNHRKFDALLSGDTTAASLGVSVDRTRRQIFLFAAFSTAVFVSIAGVIGFVGLMVPHIARALVGVLHKHLIIMAALIGALLLTASDLVARVVLSPQELPIGVVTTALGTVFVFAMLLGAKRW